MIVELIGSTSSGKTSITTRLIDKVRKNVVSCPCHERVFHPVSRNTGHLRFIGWYYSGSIILSNAKTVFGARRDMAVSDLC